MKRRQFIKTTSLAIAGAAFPASSAFFRPAKRKKPNIIFILADDLGYGELGCYGQQKIRTPNIDRMAAEGMRFTQHYSGSPVCAPSRCALMTGQHTGHAYIRGNDEMNERGDVWHDPNIEGQRPLLPGTETIGRLMQRAGYVTAAIGKWGLGGPNDSGHPNQQGFDFWYGYLCQRQAHNYYPAHLWRNSQKEILEGNSYFFPHQPLPTDSDPRDPESYKIYTGRQYSLDLLTQEALSFIQANRDKPFFLYLPFTIPHLALQVPEDALAEYEGKFSETPYLGGSDDGYLPNRTPHATYAAMITRLDREVGKFLDLLKVLQLDENTLIFFSSDNGAAWPHGGADPVFFNSNGGLKNYKGSVYEGGIRVPLIARWKGKIKPGTTSNHISACWDFYPTLAEIIGAKVPADIDGISLLPTLLGKSQKKHDYLYWEYQGQQAIRIGRWKAVRLGPDQPVELYDLESDPGEKNNVANQFPDKVEEMINLLKSARTESELFPLSKSQ
ncbi:MAG: arylsulfatase [candidate division KSB1 bacterium]|nr:arylsulfatase [candidate division KSB1 bacterium]